MAERVTRAPRAKDSETAIELQPDPTAVAQPDMPPAAPPTLPVSAAALTMPAEAVVPPAKAVEAGPTIGPAAGLALHLPIPRVGSFAARTVADVVDRASHAAAARLTAGLSPAALTLAALDWSLHLASSPGKTMSLVESAWRKQAEFGRFALGCALGRSDQQACIEPAPQDRRFASADWRAPPYSLAAQAFLLTEQWWKEATTGVRGVSAHHERVAEFAARQLLDMMAPSNFPASNPDVIRHTIEEGGANLKRGMENFADDVARAIGGQPPSGTEAFTPGRTVAVTPGKVIFRNRLIELIQYEPSTATVRPEPILIVPAWIMKYYILDLSPENSMVRHLVDAGFTVFMISWKNPTEEDRDLGFEDYRTLGIEAALDAIEAVMPGRRVHATGYCIGGTLLATAAAAEPANGRGRFASHTFLAAQTDFHEAGELTLFIDESQLAFLEDMMWERGFLDTKQMAGAFQMLRSNDLVWSRMVREYMLGDRPAFNDLMAWNADATRMPFRMHTEYLKGLFLHNDLAEGRHRVGGRAVALEDIKVPIFAVGTETDHVAPWRSVYKIGLLTDTEVTFLLTSGGHNAGIVSEPGHVGRGGRRHYRMATKSRDDIYAEPDRWLEETPTAEGSWWPAWFAWLAARSGEPVPPPPMGPALAAAPGSYVHGE